MAENTRVTRILNQLSPTKSPISNPHLSKTCKTLNDGTVIPQIGLGTWQQRTAIKTYIDPSVPRSKEQISQDQQEDIEDFKAFADAVEFAIKHGYRHIDTAQMYRTEKVIGNVIKRMLQNDASLNRSDIFITTKLEKRIRQPQDVRDSIAASLANLQTPFIDLFLIHSPHSSNKQGERGMDVINAYKILHEYKRRGYIRSVGVSNFGIKHLEALQRHKLPLPSVNQIEVHCFLYEGELIEYCKQKGIEIQAYCPIARADERVVKNDLLNELGVKYGKTWAQIMIKWLQQKDFIVITKSTKLDRIVQNGNIFDFEIDERDMKRLDGLNDQKIRVSWNPLDEPWDI